MEIVSEYETARQEWRAFSLSEWCDYGTRNAELQEWWP